uniref:Uncharacterized protein n=1 Tax=Pithovirus LCPAC302 TaxID=2506593 RepID=A0A481Z7L8_9VIRU|nr:MAG: hypothetical protein LCPAC302_00020 [Pithovirus LCPAC302]
MNFIKNEWMKYYQDFTDVEFIQHEMVDVKLLDPKITSPRVNEIFVDSCPSSPSPRSLRKSSFVKKFNLMKSFKFSRDSSSSSSTETSPRWKFGKSKNRTPRSDSEISPRGLLEKVAAKLKNESDNNPEICKTPRNSVVIC